MHRSQRGDNYNHPAPFLCGSPGPGDADIVFTRAEVEATFPGGATAWRTYLENNLQADVPVKRGAKVGSYQVIIKFIVRKDGSIDDAVAETNFGHGMEQEVIRVIKDGPRWVPAIQNGRKVNAYRRQPITFVVTK